MIQNIKYKGCDIEVARFDDERHRPYCYIVRIPEGNFGYQTMVQAKYFVSRIVKARSMVGKDRVSNREYLQSRLVGKESV